MLKQDIVHLLSTMDTKLGFMDLKLTQVWQFPLFLFIDFLWTYIHTEIKKLLMKNKSACFLKEVVYL